MDVFFNALKSNFDKTVFSNYSVKNSDEDVFGEELWEGICLMCPPNDKNLSLWVEKAYKSSTVNGAMVIGIIPARTDTSWWNDYATLGQVTFIEGRYRFSSNEKSKAIPTAFLTYCSFAPPMTNYFSKMRV